MEHILETDIIQCWPANNNSVCKQEHLGLTPKICSYGLHLFTTQVQVGNQITCINKNYQMEL